MFFIRKTEANRIRFEAALNGHARYQALSGAIADRDNVKLVLLNEQGCLCVFCEKRLDISTATIEHFLPQGTHPHFDVNYYNLYACCIRCNGRKGDHLIPSYISDKRLDAFDYQQLNLSRNQDFRFYFRIEGPDECILKHDTLSRPKTINEQFFSDSLFYYTIELLNLNDSERLSMPRRRIVMELIQHIQGLSNNLLMHLFLSHLTCNEVQIPRTQNYYLQYEEHISLKLYFIGQELRKKGLI